jgi:hypothetical protein
MANKILSGGGLTSNKLVRPGVKAGPPNTRIINPFGVAQIGASQGGKLKAEGRHTGINTAVPILQGTMRQVPMGNSVALNVGKGGPGTGRVVYGQSGTQRANTSGPMPQGREILRDFGPDLPGRKR